MATASAIQNQYDMLEKAQKAQLEAQYAKNAAAYQKQLADAPEHYQQLRNDAYVNNALAQRARRENMANMGLSGLGGASLTIEQRNNARLLGTLGDVSRQQQDYADNIHLALAGLGTQYGADLASLSAKNEAERNAALFEQSRFEAQQELAKQKSTFDQAYNLYKKRMITAAQFAAMMGISLKKK